ncbi:CaiB/BaiF CoA transferase family protein [Planococcus salinus]|uniref:CoA transferase n=1 Tax=Planococcus salinus TaxID=1848460 RepID=A0A3M8PAC4_9BACL|nr:CoA transferase [Planococcus salinus]RNF40190.1 CoA transferase [Planococcus salinus]
MTKPLEDIRVLDLSRVYAAPAGAMMLGDLGADVIRVETPGGSDSMRDWGPFVNGESAYYFSANRNKRSVTLNLNEAKGKELFLELLKKADVVIENFKTGTMEKWGLSYAELKKVNPKIITCSVTGFGHTGPLSKNPGFDPVVQAMSGLMDVTGASDGEATKVGIPIADILTSVYVALSVTAAIRQRDVTGIGQEIDLSLLDVQVSSMANVASAYLNAGMVSERLGNRHNNVTPYQVFQCSDDPIMICAGNDGLFRKLSELLGHPEWGSDPRYKTNRVRKEHEVELVSQIAAIIVTKSSEEWLDKLAQAGVPAGRVNNIAQALEQEQVQARESVETLPHSIAGEVKIMKNPMRFSQLNIESTLPPPLLGEHTESVYGELLGLDASELEKLKAANVI